MSAPAWSRPGGPRRPRNRTDWRRRGLRRRPPRAVHDGDGALLEARTVLSSFVEDQAFRLAAHVGFGWVPDSAAPDTYPDLLTAYERSEQTGQPLPVSDLFCDDTVYLDPKTNMAFRFWHDVSHVRRGLSFELVDELELACWHLDELERRTGHGPTTLAWRLLHTDLVGQVYVMALVDRFPIDQGDFTRSSAALGFDRAVLAESRRAVESDRSTGTAS